MEAEPKTTHEKLQGWMADNVYMILFLMIMFLITWILLFLDNLGVT